MNRRGLLTTAGVTALGLGIVFGGAPALPSAFAQDATPPASSVTQAQQASDFDAQRAKAYDDFVAALADELGDDKVAVDAAIRTALKQQVDARQAAGDIDAEQAAAAKAVIDVSEAPLFAFGGRGGPHGFDDHGGFAGRGPRGGDDDRNGKAPGGASLPPAQPGSAQGSDQSVPAPAAPVAGAATA